MTENQKQLKIAFVKSVYGEIKGYKEIKSKGLFVLRNKEHQYYYNNYKNREKI